MYDSFVIVDGEEILLNNVEFLNIEEHISGKDLVTFIYNGEIKQSFVIQRMKW
jgi:hypothetical protein